MEVFKLALFLISSFGWWEYLRQRCDIDVLFLPSLTVALQTVILIAAGILNLLSEVSICLYLGGFLLLFYSVAKAGGLKAAAKRLACYHQAGFYFLFISLAVLFCYLQGRVFGHDDNFSHWGIVVKLMLRADRFPNFNDPFIRYQSYPLGSSTFIYYFARFVGKEKEYIWMLAQDYLMMTCILPMFLFGKKTWPGTLIIEAAFTNLAFSYNIYATDLLVDSLISLAAAVPFVFLFRNSEKDEIWITAVYLTWLVQIKNSCLFFAVILTAWSVIRNGKKLKNGKVLFALALPYLSVFLWKKHYQSVFPAAWETKHVMSLSRFYGGFSEKTGEEIGQICREVMKFSLTYPKTIHALLYLLCLGFLVLLAGKGLRQWLKYSLAAISVYFAYQTGLLGMYLFSMPTWEATHIAGIGRYTMTVLLFIHYFTTVGFLILLSEEWGKPLLYRIAAICAAVLMLCGVVCRNLFFNCYFPVATRQWYEKAKEEYCIPEGESYCNIVVGEHTWYTWYIQLYLFLSADADTVFIDENFDAGRLDQITQKYVFITDQAAENETVAAWVEANYPEQAGRKVIVRAD